MNHIVRDPALYFIQTLLLRPARETGFRLTPLYRVFAAWQSLTGLSEEVSPTEAQQRLDRGGGWTLWSKSGELEQVKGSADLRWRVRADTFGDDLCLLCGIETQQELPELPAARTALPPEWNDWLDDARARLYAQWQARTSTFRQALAESVVGPAAEAPQASQLRATGVAWLCLYEWMTEPDWEVLGQARFQRGAWQVFDWGILGTAPQSLAEQPVWEAHVLASPEKHKRAEEFIFQSLPELLIFYLKVTQLLTPRYRRTQAPQARTLDTKLARLLEAVNQMEGNLNLRGAESFLAQMATQLGEFRTVLATMTIDLHTARIDYENAERLLQRHLSPAPPGQGSAAPYSLLRPLKLYVEQAEKDLEYYRLTLDGVQQTLELLKLRTEMLRVRFANALASLGAGFGIFLGLGQLIDPNYLKEYLQRSWPGFWLSPHGNLARALFCFLLAGLASWLVFWLLNRFLWAKPKAGLAAP